VLERHAAARAIAASIARARTCVIRREASRVNEQVSTRRIAS
jgi:hypothetical protein